MENKNELKKSYIEDYFKIVDPKKGAVNPSPISSILDVDPKGVEITDETNKYEIYARGVSIKKHKKSAVEAFGFMIYKNEKLIYENEKMNIVSKIVNHRSEIESIHFSLEYLKKYLEQEVSNPNNFVFIYSDSEYTTKCLTDWARNWHTADWKIKKNADIVIQCLEMIQKYNIEIRLLPSETNTLLSKHRERYTKICSKFENESN